jgi:hypothetical protein
MTRRATPTACTENFPGSDIAVGTDEWEFLKAMERYQRRAGRRYPTWREVLRVLRSLGYRKVPPPSTDSN